MTEQEFQAELAKRDQQIQGLAAERNAFRQTAEAWKKLGESFEPGTIQYDANGSPVGLVPPTPGGGANGSHPFSGLVADPGSVDTWVQGQVNALVARQGFITNAQVNALLQSALQQTDRSMNAYIRLYHGLQETLQDPSYAGLKTWDDPLAKKTREIAQAQGWATFPSEAKGWLDGSYADVQGLSKAARMARAELSLETSAAAAAASSGQAAQGAAQLGAGSGGAAGAGGPGQQVTDLIGKQAPVHEVSAALDQAVGAT